MDRQQQNTRTRYHAVEQRATMLRFYYSAFNADGAFCAEIATLIGNVPASLVRVSLDQLVGCARLELPEYACSRALYARLMAFTSRWALPSDHGIEDLWYSVQRAVNNPHPRILTAPRAFGINSENGWTITPHETPAAFEYNPIVDSASGVRDYAAKVAEQLRQSIIRQAEALEAQVELQSVSERPTRYRTRDAREDVQMAATRLYRRAALGWSWPQIHRAEPGAPSDRAIRLSTEHWADELKVPITRRGKSGRPRKL